MMLPKHARNRQAAARTALRAALLNPDLWPGKQALLNIELVALLTMHAARFAAPAYEAVQARAIDKTAQNRASLARRQQGA